MIAELRNRFAAHKRRWGRMPRSWTLSRKRWNRLLAEQIHQKRYRFVDEAFGIIAVHGVMVSRREEQFRILIPAGHWRLQRL
jgi:hypothetical protein